MQMQIESDDLKRKIYLAKGSKKKLKKMSMQPASTRLRPEKSMQLKKAGPKISTLRQSLKNNKPIIGATFKK